MPMSEVGALDWPMPVPVLEAQAVSLVVLSPVEGRLVVEGPGPGRPVVPVEGRVRATGCSGSGV